MMASERSFASLGSRAKDLETSWEDRLVDAERLMFAGRHPTAIAMGLYALEILLKARVCRLLNLEQLPKPFEIHDLEGLLTVSGLRHALYKKPARRTKANWARIKVLASDLNAFRYLPNDSRSREEAEEFFASLNEEPSGIITWILNQP